MSTTQGLIEHNVDANNVFFELVRLLGTHEFYQRSKKGNVIMVILQNVAVSPQHDKIHKKRTIFRGGDMVHQIGYTLKVSRLLKQSLSQVGLKYLSSYDVEGKLCLILGLKPRNINEKIRHFLNLYNIPVDWKWKITKTFSLWE